MELTKAQAELALSVSAGGNARGMVGRFFMREAGISLALTNKIHHIFSQSRHNLGGLARSLGGEVKAFRAIESATVKSVDVSKAGRFETIVKVGSEQVTVRGNVIDGQVKIGTAFIKPPPPPTPPIKL
ncbi:hypothetical protein MNO14_14420 [Luteimonas sp. S4-F44]|uniref:hypothetical protein n=1 Tax=Luteimonas sp. S4-F44 TaxID=2925842 RepID=UPI001F5365DC|nr:hypothetical protein [Luteimonas sp. S4-F44]UNK44215.1 hypothetical protein MNO14_14420 [Luteimonas sp. S4-F44]